MSIGSIQSELVNLACQSLNKCTGPESQVPICAIDIATGDFKKLPDKCALFKFNCDKQGREYETTNLINLLYIRQQNDASSSVFLVNKQNTFFF